MLKIIFSASVLDHMISQQGHVHHALFLHTSFIKILSVDDRTSPLLSPL